MFPTYFEVSTSICLNPKADTFVPKVENGNMLRRGNKTSSFNFCQILISECHIQLVAENIPNCKTHFHTNTDAELPNHVK